MDSYQRTVKSLVKGRIYTNSPKDDDGNRIWPQYCYYFTDLQNALKIFQAGQIYSRNYVQANNLDHSDDLINQKMLQNTNQDFFNYVRLYFRPRVPLLDMSEGFRPKSAYKNHTRCPFPVYFLFDLPRILELRDSRFSPVSLDTYGKSVNSKNVLENGPAAFYDLPFEAIYSNKFSGDYDSEYYHDREQAEVLVRKHLLLRLLKKIVVRTDAEKTTLEQELLDRNLERYSSKIEVDHKGLFFFKHGGYFDDISTSNNEFQAKLVTPVDYFSNHYVEDKQLNQYLGFKRIIKYPNDVKHNRTFPVYTNQYYSNPLCQFKIFAKPYIIKLYLNNQQEPAYYHRYDAIHIKNSDLPF